ncbi:MAG: lamin tail domain-containing protein, partial [bacterium]
MQYPKMVSWFSGIYFATGLFLVPVVNAQLSQSLTGPATASVCDTLTLTNIISNTGGVLSGLRVTNSLPSGNFSYVAGQTVITEPGPVTRSGTNADPDLIIGGTNLVWDFSTLATPCTIDHVLISEVYYNDSHTAAENKNGYQWVELFNPTAAPITLNDCSLKDAVSGVYDSLPTMTLAAGEFVIVAGSTNAFKSGSWGYTGQLFEVADGAIGNGLNDYGDGVFLYQGATLIDGMSYGNSQAAFSLPYQISAIGSSLARTPVANRDTDTAAEWATLPVPTPGSGEIPLGLQTGGGVTIIYKVAGSCSADTGLFASKVAFKQPPSAAATVVTTTKSIALYAGDLLVSETPLMQNASRYGPAAWLVSVKNLGLGSARNVVITDRLSSGFQFTGSDVVPASTAVGADTVMTWDQTVIPGLADLAPDATISVAVTGRVALVTNLYNKADVQWGCTTSTVCQSSATASNTITAGINLVDLVPRLSAWLTPAAPVAVGYCAGATVTLHITNAAGPTVGTAFNVAVSNILPASLIGTNQIYVGDLPSGASTNIAITLLAGGDCPISTNAQTAYFTFSYHDSMDRAYGPPTVFSVVQVTQPPSASVQVSVPASQTSTEGGAIPVKVYFTYNNFDGTEVITLRETYPASTNLTPTAISAGGYLDGTDVVWTNSGFIGSGVYTASFNLAIGSLCGGPFGYIQNRVTVPDFMNCRRCTTSVTGSGERYLTYFGAGAGCVTGGGGGTGVCSYASIKTTPTNNLVEVCQPVWLSHSFTNFTGMLPGWSNITFTSDLGGVTGNANTNDVTVGVNGSNLTAFCTSMSGIGSLTVNLSGLTNSLYPDLSGVTNLTITWKMQTVAAGQVHETSTLHVPVCGGTWAEVYWNVGASDMSVSLDAIEYLEACGITTGRIDLAQLSSPGLMSGSNAVFASYDVRVTLDLDADGNGASEITYEDGSTVFSNMVLLGGAPTNGFNPVISSNKLTWTIGSLDPNGAGSIFYILRGACARSAPEKQAAKVEFNTHCAQGEAPLETAFSQTNAVPSVCPAGRMSVEIQPEVTFLTETQYVVRMSFMNTGAGTAYNVTPELIIPTNVVFNSASIGTSDITSTSVVWTLQNVSNPGNLIDADGDGKADDLAPLGQFEILATNSILSFGQNAVHARVSHGCNSNTCQSATSVNATFQSNAGALAAHTAFDANGKLCNTNAAKIIILNTGLIKDYDIHVFEVLPDGMTYVAGSSRYVYGGVTTNALSDPAGTGAPGDKLNWGSAQIPTLAGLPAGGELTILFSTLASCGANTGNKQYSTSATYVDIGRNLNSVAAVSTIQVLDIPALSVVVGASPIVVDHNRTNVYTISVDHSAGSIVNVPAMQLVDVMPTNVTFLGASVAPDTVSGNSMVSGETLTWGNATLMGLSGGAPYTPAKLAVSITVTGLVLACNYIDNRATVSFGCDTDSLCLSNGYTQRSISIPLVAIGDQSALTLSSWGGTRTVVVTNTGATGRGVIITNIAPSGFVFTEAASVAGEFTGSSLIVHLSGTPLGRFAYVDFTTAASSGATDSFDDAADGPDNLDMGNGKGFVVTFNLISDGSGMDTVANPLDVGYADPEPVVLSEVTAPATLIYSNLCEEIAPQTVNQSVKTIPIRPDPDIDLLPHSLIVTNGQAVTFTLSVINAADAGYSTNLHVRLKFGEGWSNLTCLSTNLVQSGAGTVQMEMMGSTNVLIELPGVALNTTLNNLAMTFRATAVQGAGPLYALAEVVGESPVAASITYIGTNTLGAAPLLNTMQGLTIFTNNGTYYGFDQVEGFGAGFEVNGNIRYANSATLVNQLTARIGEPLVFHLVANFFGTAYSNIVLTQSRETNLVFGTPGSYVYVGGITNAVYDAVAGTFTLQPILVDTSALSSFTVDVPVWVRNSLTNQTGVSFTNVIIPTFTVAGVTNLPPNSTNIVSLVEPTLSLAMTCDTNNIQAGDVVTFTNIITHVGSTTNAYDIVFSNSLPSGMTFAGVEQVGPWVTNGSVLTVSGAELSGLTNLALGGTVTIVVKAKVMNQLVGSTIFNVATIYYTSLFGAGANERNGSDGAGGLNDYTTSASVGVLAMPLTGIRKSAGNSSQNNTVAPDLTIGERILYTIRVDVPNGVSTNLQVTDHLPPGLDWVGNNPAAGLTYPGKGYQFVIPEGGPVFSTNAGAGLTISDPDSTPDSSLTTDGAGQAVRFTIAVITNTPDSPAVNDYFDLSLECVVVDDGVNNTGKSPFQKSWSNQVTVIDGFSTNTTNSVAYILAEPDVMIGHTLSPIANLDAGDPVTITLYVTNSAAARANAYDIRVLDTLPLADFDVSTLVWETPETGWAVTTNVNGANLEYRFASTATTPLLTNSVVTNRFSVRLAQGVTPNLIISNAVQLEASDTINGDPPAGIPYRSTTSAKTYLSLTVTNLSVAKSFYGTSETNAADSSGQLVQVGEMVTYQLAVTLPEGTISNLVVTDLIPRGMQYVTNRVGTAGFGGSLGSPMGIVSNGSSGSPVSFVFTNNTVVTNNNDVNDNTFSIQVDAVVLNTNINYGTSTVSRTFFTNKCSVSFGGNLPATTNVAVIVTNIEPVIAISTSFRTNRMDAGDTNTVYLVVTNTGLATAYDVVVTDALNTVYFDTNTIENFKVNGAGPAGYLLTSTNGMVWIVSDVSGTNPPTCSLEANEGITFSFDVKAAQTVPPNLTITNRAGIYADTIAGYAVNQRTVTGQVATATNQSPDVTIAKTFIGTSETNAVDSTNQYVQIGETVTYQLAVTLPEGTISNLV